MASIFSRIPPKAFTTSALILADILTDDLSLDEQNTLANWLQLVGQVILTNAGQEQLISNVDSSNDSTSNNTNNNSNNNSNNNNNNSNNYYNNDDDNTEIKR